MAPSCRRSLCVGIVLAVAALLLQLSRIFQPTQVVQPVTVQSPRWVESRTAFTSTVPAVTAAARKSTPPKLDARYAYGVEAPLELPSPPPPGPEVSTSLPPGHDGLASRCRANPLYDRFLHQHKWAAADMLLAKGLAKGGGGSTGGSGDKNAASKDPGYLCYQHRDVDDDPRLGRRTCRPPFNPRSCPVRRPTFASSPGGCLCCPMARHTCPPCWGCLLPLSRRRVFASKLYERETGGTANVYFASEDIGGEVSEIIYKVRDLPRSPLLWPSLTLACSTVHMISARCATARSQRRSERTRDWLRKLGSSARRSHPLTHHPPPTTRHQLSTTHHHCAHRTPHSCTPATRRSPCTREPTSGAASSIQA